jgi:hypothetical protein
MKDNKIVCGEGLSGQISEIKEYKPLTKESLESILDDVFNEDIETKKVLKVWTGDGKGGCCLLEDSPQFHEAMKEHVSKMWGGEYADIYIKSALK